MSEQQKRELAKAVYRVLRDHVEREFAWSELVTLSGLFHVDEVLTAVYWMRSKGVAIVYRPGQVVGEPGRVALKERLPEAFEVSTFPHGLESAAGGS